MPPKTKKVSDRIQPNLITVKNALSVSLRRIAAATGKTYSVVCYYFNGKNNPPEDWINTFCAVYCVDKDWLINGTGEPVFTGRPTLSVILKSSQNAGDRVKSVRKEAGLTQNEFGERIGLSQIGVCNIEKNASNLTPFSAGRIEDQFDVGADWLMFGDEGKKNFPVSEKLIKWLWENENIRERLWREMERQTQTGQSRHSADTDSEGEK